MRAIYDNFGEDEELAVSIHNAVISSKQDGFRNNAIKSNRIKRALSSILSDDDAIDKAFQLIVEQEEY